MRAFLLIAILMFYGVPDLAQGQTVRQCTSGTRVDLLTCITTMLDINPTDGTITASEIDEFILGAPASCISGDWLPYINGTDFVAMCDAAGGGDLDMDDWNHADGCFRTKSREVAMCEFCIKCSP